LADGDAEAGDRARAGGCSEGADAQAEELPDLRDDPWHYLDVARGEERLRAYLQHERLRERRG